jgi:Short C-terminal domain
VIGGVAAVAHHAGTRSGQAQAAEQEQDDQIAGLQQQQQAPPPPPPAAAASSGDDMFKELEQLKQLLDDGVLTQDEFDAQKQKLLASS